MGGISGDMVSDACSCCFAFPWAIGQMAAEDFSCARDGKALDFGSQDGNKEADAREVVLWALERRRCISALALGRSRKLFSAPVVQSNGAEIGPEPRLWSRKMTPNSQ